MHRLTTRFFAPFLALAMAGSAFAIAPVKKKIPPKKGSGAAVARTKLVRAVALTHQPDSHLLRLKTARKRYIYSPWTEPTFADSTLGDSIDGEDLVVRRAAVQALGPFNGSVVAVDADNGRVLSIVNQNLAYKSGFQPCSTIKLVATLAGLNEGLIDRTTLLRVGRRSSMDLTDALARSNNLYFAQVGERLGFERVTKYAQLYGLGERACWNLPQEQLGTLPDAAPPEGMGMMTSFGSGIHLTPLQLAAMVSAMANGGNLYYLQRPRSSEEIQNYVPKLKRQLDIAQLMPDVKPGMMGAVEYGTARRAMFDPNQPIYGKTGTCSDERNPGVHLGWFASFNDTGDRKVAVVVLLTGGRPVNGPVAAGVAGSIFRDLSEQGYFGRQSAGIVPVSLISSPNDTQ